MKLAAEQRFNACSSPRTPSSPGRSRASWPPCSGIRIHVPIWHRHPAYFPMNIATSQPRFFPVLHPLKRVVLLEDVTEDIHMVGVLMISPQITQLNIWDPSVKKSMPVCLSHTVLATYSTPFVKTDRYFTLVPWSRGTIVQGQGAMLASRISASFFIKKKRISLAVRTLSSVSNHW